MLIDQLFPNDVVRESAYGAEVGIDVFKQLIQSFKEKKQIDLKVGPEQFPLRYDEARYLLSIWRASDNKGKTAELFGDVNWIQSQLEQRDYKMSPDRLNDLDIERAKEIDKEKVLNLETNKCPVTGEDECHCDDGQLDEILPAIAGAAIRGLGGAALRGAAGLAAGAALGALGSDDKEMNEAEFEITYKDPQFTGTRTHTIKSVNAKKAQEKFLSFGNPYKVLDVKKKEAVKEYKLEPRDKEDKLEKLKTLNQLLVDPNTSKDPELKKAIQKRISQLQEDPTPKRRIMDFDSRYWSGNGKYQDEYSNLYDKLVPREGKSDTVEGELLRAVGKIIYRHGNDGDNFSHGSYNWIEKYVGEFKTLDEMADKVIEHILSKKGDYTPNNVDWVMDIADYGPGEYEKDWEQVGCQNCGGTGEIEYENDDGQEDFEECDYCDGNGWIEQTSESINEDVNGWKYGQEMEDYDDVRKIHHYAKKDGKEVTMDWSPYTTPTADEFKLWIDLGMPTRKAVKGIGPLNLEDLLQLAKDNPKVTHSLLAREDKEADAIDTKKLDARTKVALKKAGLKYGAQTKGDPLASLVTFVADKDTEKTQDIDRLDKENDEEEADIARQGQVDKKHDQAIGNNALKDRYQDQELDKLKQSLEKILNR